MAEPPARIILAKSGRLDQRLGFEFEAVGPGFANDFWVQDSRAPGGGNTIYRGRGFSTQGFKPRLSQMEIRAYRQCATKADKMRQKRCHWRLQERSTAAISPRSGHGV